MSLLLSEAGPSAQSIGQNIQMLAFWASIASNIALVVAMFIRPKISPQPLVVRQEIDAATDKACKDRAADLQKLVDKLFALRESDIAAESDKREKIYEAIEANQKDLTKQIAAIPSHVMALLANMNQIAKSK